MIDFELTEKDEKILDSVRKESLVCRKYARYYDEHEHEFPPDELPEANEYGDIYGMFGESEGDDSGLGVLSMLISSGQTWGDYSVRMRRGSGGLGNAALRASGTPEQQQRFGSMTLAMAITEPGCDA